MEEAVTALEAGLELATPRGRHTSALLSSPLTVLAALSAVPELRSRPKLTVHCVGSRRIEAASAWSLLLSLAPGLTSVTLIFVGLEVVVPDTQDTRPGLELVHLPPCAYHEYAASPGYTEPDLVAALNCGFILYSSWAASLPAMVRASGAPLVFTEYYEQDCRANLDLVTATLQGAQVSRYLSTPSTAISTHPAGGGGAGGGQEPPPQPGVGARPAGDVGRGGQGQAARHRGQQPRLRRQEAGEQDGGLRGRCLLSIFVSKIKLFKYLICLSISYLYYRFCSQHFSFVDIFWLFSPLSHAENHHN